VVRRAGTTHPCLLRFRSFLTPMRLRTCHDVIESEINTDVI
jgi:hypothetical protein